MALDTNLGFHFSHIEGDKTPTYRDYIVADAAFREGDVVNFESGQLDLAVTSDTAIIGVVNETKSSMTTGTTEIQIVVINDTDVVFSVYDPNARTAGATLDIAGATGAMTVAATSNKELVVIETSTATQPTLVRFNSNVLFYQVAQ